MKISFDFDPITKQVSNIEVNEGPTVKTARASSPSKQSGKIVLTGSSLKLTQEVLDLLKVDVGDKLIISFTNDMPALVTPKAANMLKAGNLITKSLTISCKGKTGATLSAYGNEWDFALTSEGFLVLTNDTIDTPIKEEMPQVLLDDSDFLSTVNEGEEIDFSFEITNKKK